MGAALALALTAGCAITQSGPPRAGPRAIIETSAGAAVFYVEIADSDDLRSRGLTGRERLGGDEGMAFLWPEDTTTAFHMRDTLIALTVAFFDVDGRILRLLDMVPCRADPCPAYDPGVRYRGALEVNAGALERRGVRVGDRVRIER